MRRESRTVSLERRGIGTSSSSNTSVVQTRSTPSCPTRPLSFRSLRSQGSSRGQFRDAAAPSRSFCRKEPEKHGEKVRPVVEA
jgi:hypothetical protein